MNDLENFVQIKFVLETLYSGLAVYILIKKERKKEDAHWFDHKEEQVMNHDEHQFPIFFFLKQPFCPTKMYATT